MRNCCNAFWVAVATVAGALDLRLGGPTQYPHALVEKPWLGEGGPDVSPVKMNAALKLVSLSTYIAGGMAVLLML